MGLYLVLQPLPGLALIPMGDASTLADCTRSPDGQSSSNPSSYALQHHTSSGLRYSSSAQYRSSAISGAFALGMTSFTATTPQSARWTQRHCVDECVDTGHYLAEFGLCRGTAQLRLSSWSTGSSAPWWSALQRPAFSLACSSALLLYLPLPPKLGASGKGISFPYWSGLVPHSSRSYVSSTFQPGCSV